MEKATKNSPELLLLKFLPLTYSHFLATTLNVFAIAFFGLHTFILQLGCFGLENLTAHVVSYKISGQVKYHWC